MGTRIHPTRELTPVHQPRHPPSLPKEPRVSTALQGTSQGKGRMKTTEKKQTLTWNTTKPHPGNQRVEKTCIKCLHTCGQASGSTWQ